MLKLVNFSAKLARRMHLQLIKRTLEVIEVEPDLAGFAIIAWDHRGLVTTSLHTSSGPISDAMLPAYVCDALNRRVASEDAVSQIRGKAPDAPA